MQCLMPAWRWHGPSKGVGADLRKSSGEECENIGVQKSVVRKYCKKLELLNLKENMVSTFEYIKCFCRSEGGYFLSYPLQTK